MTRGEYKTIRVNGKDKVSKHDKEANCNGIKSAIRHIECSITRKWTLSKAADYIT
jgi:hypothetical protein